MWEEEEEEEEEEQQQQQPRGYNKYVELITELMQNLEVPGVNCLPLIIISP